jgi:large subunit ribosomal protein L3
MSIGLVGRKCGMTRVFTDEGAIPVTVIEVLPNRVTQIKALAQDKYYAVQVTTGSKKLSRLTRPLKQHFVKAGAEPGRGLWEFRVTDAAAIAGLSLGGELKLADVFTVGQYVDVQGITKGKGFAGTIKRHHFAGQDATHGNSLSHRVPGSIGQRQTPGRVFKGKKMAGHLGNVRRTVLSQPVISIEVENNLLLVRGAVPGATNSTVIIRPAIKKANSQQGGE